MPKKKGYTFNTKIWLYPGMAGWHFISLPKADAKQIKETFGKTAKGWGSIPITVTIGKTRWNTSIFPDKKSGTYLLPIKAPVRKKEDLGESDTVKVNIIIR